MSLILSMAEELSKHTHYSAHPQPSSCFCFTKLRGAYDKFPDFFHMGTFIDSTHMKFLSPWK